MKKRITKRSRIMDFVQAHGTVRRCDIVKFICDMNNFPYTGNYYSQAFAEATTCNAFRKPLDKKCGYLLRPSRNDPRFLVKLFVFKGGKKIGRPLYYCMQ